MGLDFKAIIALLTIINRAYYISEENMKENKKKPVLAIILGIILLILVVGGVFVMANWNRSLGEPLGLPTRTSKTNGGSAGSGSNSEAVG